MTRIQAATLISYVALVLALEGCGDNASDHEKARSIWDANIAAVEEIIAAGGASHEELERLENFFWPLTGQRAVAEPTGFESLMISSQAKVLLRGQRAWCDENCHRLSLDPVSGEVIVLELPAKQP